MAIMYYVAFLPEDIGYSAIVLNLSGCGSQGDTLEEARLNVREAIEAVVASYIENGETVPLVTDYEIPEDCLLEWIYNV